MIINVEGYWGLAIRNSQTEPFSNSDVEYWEKWYTAEYTGKQATVVNIYQTTGE
jgi:hypothetical protein